MVSILVPSEGMGPYVVSQQDEAFLLVRIGKPGDGAGSSGEGNWYVPVGEIPQLLAALRQAAAVSVGSQPSGAQWTVGSDGHVAMQIDGPCLVHSAGPVLGVLIQYVDLPLLMAALASWTPPEA